MILRVRSAVGRPYRSWQESVQVIVGTFDSLLFSVCCVSLVQLLTICISYAFYICCLRESGSKYARNCVYLGKMKIVPSYHHKSVSHPMPEQCSSLWTSNLQSFSSLTNLATSKACFPRRLFLFLRGGGGDIQFLPCDLLVIFHLMQVILVPSCSIFLVLFNDMFD